MPSSTQHQSSNLTKNQSLVLRALVKAGGPLSAYAILDKLHSKGFRAPLQVYRALEKLQIAGLVHRLESLNAFVACSHPDSGTHEAAFFTICENCAEVREINDAGLARQLRNLARAQTFRLTKSTVELRGRCESCSAP